MEPIRDLLIGKKRLVAAVLISMLGLSVPVISFAFCNTYEDSRVVIDFPDVYCGSTGFACTECVNVSDSSSNSCWTDGITTICETANGGFRLY